VVGIAAYAMVLNRERSLSIAARLAVRLPVRLRKPLLDLADSILRGLTLLRSPGRFVATGVLSLVIWMVPVLGLTAYFRSVSGQLHPVTLFLALTLFTITQAISVTPASVGTFEGLFVLVLTAFGASPASVLTAAAVIAHVGGIAALLVMGAFGALWLRVYRPALPVRLKRSVPG